MNTTTIASEPKQGLRRHKLMPAEIRRSIPSLYATDGQGGEAIAHLKLFSPLSGFTLYVTEFDGEDELFGYCVSPLGPDCSELGYSSLRELASREGRLSFAGTPFGPAMPAIERDLSWTPCPLRECQGYLGQGSAAEVLR